MQSGKQTFRVSTGIPFLRSSICRLDKATGRGSVRWRGVLTDWSSTEFPLSDVEDVRMVKRRRNSGSIYQASISLRSEGAIRLAASRRAQMSRAVIAIRDFLGIQTAH